MSRKRKRKRRGHFCWCCGRMRPNERFSGKGHARHLCRDCSRLGKTELAYRQAVRDLERTVTWEGFVRPKQRKTLESFLSHPDERIRVLAQSLIAHDAQLRQQPKESCGEEWIEPDEVCPDSAFTCDEGLEHSDTAMQSRYLEDQDEDIPF